MSGHILHLSILHSPVFLLNSRLLQFSAASSRWRPFSRSYGAILPNSLTVIHSSALVYSTRLRVSVYGTSAHTIRLADFLGSMVTRTIHSPQGLAVLSGSTLGADLPTPINVYTLQRTIPSVRGAFTTPSPHHSYGQYGIINPFVHRSCRSA